MENLCIKRITLKPLMFNDRRTNMVQTPSFTETIITTHLFKMLCITVVNSIANHQVITGISSRISSPFGLKHHLNRELIIEKIDVVDVGDIHPNIEFRTLGGDRFGLRWSPIDGLGNGNIAGEWSHRLP